MKSLSRINKDNEEASDQWVKENTQRFERADMNLYAMNREIDLSEITKDRLTKDVIMTAGHIKAKCEYFINWYNKEIGDASEN